jgi:hypothetical protein
LSSRTFQDDAEAVIAALSPDERRRAVAYLTVVPVPGRTTLSLPGTTIRVETETRLGFVDQDPTANWGHAARYILLAGGDAGLSASTPARLPPFAKDQPLQWQVVYRAPGLPESAIAPG